MQTTATTSLFILTFLLAGCASNENKNPANDKNADASNLPSRQEKKDDSTAGGRKVHFLFWNVESEGADPKVIAKQIRQFKKYDVFAFCEVNFSDFDTFEEACGDSFDSIRSKSGNRDRLQILYNKEKFELVRQMELDDINHEGRYRSPLVAHLKDKESQKEFLVMTVHLARNNRKPEIRQGQAKKLVTWARDQSLPVIAIGDFNFDFVFETESGNEAFKIFVRDGVWKWVRPKELIDTNWYDPEPDGKDNFPGSILDFAFVAGEATEWNPESKVIVREGDFPDDKKTSDHRPIDLMIELPGK